LAPRPLAHRSQPVPPVAQATVLVETAARAGQVLLPARAAQLAPPARRRNATTTPRVVAPDRRLQPTHSDRPGARPRSPDGGIFRGQRPVKRSTGPRQTAAPVGSIAVNPFLDR